MLVLCCISRIVLLFKRRQNLCHTSLIKKEENCPVNKRKNRWRPSQTPRNRARQANFGTHMMPKHTIKKRRSSSRLPFSAIVVTPPRASDSWLHPRRPPMKLSPQQMMEPMPIHAKQSATHASDQTALTLVMNIVREKAELRPTRPRSRPSISCHHHYQGLSTTAATSRRGNKAWEAHYALRDLDERGHVTFSKLLLLPTTLKWCHVYLSFSDEQHAPWIPPVYGHDREIIHMVIHTTCYPNQAIKDSIDQTWCWLLVHWIVGIKEGMKEKTNRLSEGNFLAAKLW